MLLFGCETTKLSEKEEIDFQEMIITGKSDSDYYVYAKGINFDDAEKKAKDMLLIHRVSVMIGEDYERSYRNDIQQKIYSNFINNFIND